MEEETQTVSKTFLGWMFSQLNNIEGNHSCINVILNLIF